MGNHITYMAICQHPLPSHAGGQRTRHPIHPSPVVVFAVVTDLDRQDCLSRPILTGGCQPSVITTGWGFFNLGEHPNTEDPIMKLSLTREKGRATGTSVDPANTDGR